MAVDGPETPRDANVVAVINGTCCHGRVRRCWLKEKRIYLNRWSPVFQSCLFICQLRTHRTTQGCNLWGISCISSCWFPLRLRSLAKLRLPLLCYGRPLVAFGSVRANKRITYIALIYFFMHTNAQSLSPLHAVWHLTVQVCFKIFPPELVLYNCQIAS